MEEKWAGRGDRGKDKGKEEGRERERGKGGGREGRRKEYLRVLHELGEKDHGSFLDRRLHNHLTQKDSHLMNRPVRHGARK